MSTLPQVFSTPRAQAWAVWLLPAAALVLLLAWETDWGRQIVRVPATPAPVEPKPVAAAVLPEYQIDGGLPAHVETVERTLFNATRRPAPVLAADSGPRQVARGKFQLMGTTVTGDRNIAFLKEVGGGKTRVVRQGDEIDGMKVALVTADRVQFTAGDDSEELVLKVAPGPRTTIAAAPAAAGAPVAGAPAAAGGGAGAARAAAAARAQAAANQATPATSAAPEQTGRAARRAARSGAMTGQGADGQQQTTGAGTGSQGGHGGGHGK